MFAGVRLFDHVGCAPRDDLTPSLDYSSTLIAHRKPSARYWAQAGFSRVITRTVFFPTRHR
jgi:hypothetical protein